MRLQNKIKWIFIAFLTVSFINAQSKKASPAAVATGKINNATITINYSSPSVKGRKIWGELVPFDKVWRAGANEATTFETDKDLTIEGSKLAAGKYSFFVIPNEKECILIFNKEAKQWGASKYKESEDQLRVSVKPRVVNSSTESLIYVVNDNSVILKWDQWEIPFKVK